MNTPTTLSVVALCALVSCASLSQFAEVAGSSGLLDRDTSQVLTSVGKVSKAVDRANQEITPEQEYYIGRAVGANILYSYKPFDVREANRYLNVLVKILSQHSKKPETFGGYHVLILDSDEVNAFAAPGGLIFVTRGMLRFCPNETAVAAVLAHEIAHVQLEHGLQAIKQERINNAFAIGIGEAAKTFGNEDVKRLTAEFGGSITDITKTMVNSGYSREFEGQADQAAVEILKSAGYNPAGLILMLKEMKKVIHQGGNDFAKTHPSPDARISVVQQKIGRATPVDEPEEWTARMKRALSGV